MLVLLLGRRETKYSEKKKEAVMHQVLIELHKKRRTLAIQNLLVTKFQGQSSDPSKLR